LATVLLLIRVKLGDKVGSWTAALLLTVFTVTAQAQTNQSVSPGPPDRPTTSPANSPGQKSPSDVQENRLLRSVVPDAPSYVALTGHQKLELFVRQTYSPYTFIGATFDAGFAQLQDDWPAYGQGMEGYGKRYGALLADREAGSLFQTFLLPTLFHQDPRYFRQGPQKSVLPRVKYAASRVLITRADDGHNTFNTSLVLGTLLVKSLTNGYYPEPQRGFSDTMARFGTSLLSSAQTNLLREFWPDIKSIFRKHEPEKLKKLEEKIPLGKKFLADDDTDYQPLPSGPAK
jgi:hypothetical protein